MARADSKAEIQHYVPRMLLRKFAAPDRTGKEQLYAYDKQDGRSFVTNVANVAAERRFYDFPQKGVATLSLEPALTEIESAATVAFQTIMDRRSLAALSDSNKLDIGMFVAVQHMRGKHFRESQREFDAELSAFIVKNGGDPAHVEGYTPLSGEDELKSFHLSFLAKEAPHFAGMMLAKRWALFETRAEAPFLIGDNPVALHNNEQFGPYGNIGLLVPGIEIYLPLSPTMTLGLLCPTFETRARATKASLEEFRQAWRRSPEYVASVDEVLLRHMLNEATSSTDMLVSALESGEPIPCDEQNLKYLNWLQVRWAERYVFSSRNEFALVRDILEKSPDARRGPRMRTS